MMKHRLINYFQIILERKENNYFYMDIFTNKNIKIKPVGHFATQEF